MTTGTTRPVRILQTADVHLGVSAEAFGDRAGELRQQLQRTFERIIDEALAAPFDLLVIAGDLFDAARPAPRNVEFVNRQLARLGEAKAPVRVAILPGTHDRLGEASVYGRGLVGAGMEHVTVFADPGPQRVGFEDLQVVVHGTPSGGGGDPLEGHELQPEGWAHIALAHGSVGSLGEMAGEGDTIREGSIAASGMTYVALGHWHGLMDCSEGGIAAYYSGAPEPLALDQRGTGQAVEVVIESEGHVQVTPRRVGRLRAEQTELDVGECEGEEALVQRLRELAGEDLLLDVVLRGLTAPDVQVNAATVEETLAGEFFRLRLRDESHVALDRIDADEFPEERVIGKFVRVMRERIGAAPDDEAKKIAEEALQLGVALLQGKDVLSAH